MTPRIDRGAHRAGRGSALIVALVFLIILTILGLSTMTTSRLELKMANNAQFADRAYQAAESGIELTLALPGLETLLPSAPSAPPLSRSFAIGGQTVQTVTRSIPSKGSGGKIEGSDLQEYTALNYEIDSLGSGAGGGEAQHVQGFYILAKQSD